MIRSENNKQYLVSYFYKHVAFLKVFFIKELACSIVVVVHAFCMTLQQHLNRCINIYLQGECHKISFICCFDVTAENLI